MKGCDKAGVGVCDVEREVGGVSGAIMGCGTREGVVTGGRGGGTGWLTVVRVEAKA